MWGAPSGAAPHLSQELDLGREKDAWQGLKRPMQSGIASHQPCCLLPTTRWGSRAPKQALPFHYLQPLGSAGPWGTGLWVHPVSLPTRAGPMLAHLQPLA